LSVKSKSECWRVMLAELLPSVICKLSHHYTILVPSSFIYCLLKKPTKRLKICKHNVYGTDENGEAIYQHSRFHSQEATHNHDPTTSIPRLVDSVLKDQSQNQRYNLSYLGLCLMTRQAISQQAICEDWTRTHA
jgi:hypothetical protein